MQNTNAGNGAAIDIHAYNGSDSQKFLFDLQNDGTYRIRTTLAGNRALDLFNGFTTNGTKIQLWDDNGGVTQRWYLIPVLSGWYRIAAKMNINTGLDVSGVSAADGSLLQNWNYLGGANQLWNLSLPAGAVATVAGHIALEDIADLSAVSPNAPVGVFHIEFRASGAANVIKAADVSLTPVSSSPYGAFLVPGVPVGVYDVFVKGQGSLRVALPKVTVNFNTPLPNITLPGGDANGDNAVDVLDFSLLVNAYGGDASAAGSGYNGSVDVLDFRVLVNNYGSVGAN